MRRSEATEIVSDLAAQQWGLLTAAQARSAGVESFMLSRLVDQGILMRVRHGVYAASSAPWSPVLEIRAQWLALDPKIMAVDRRNDDENAVTVSHETAAELHGIGDLPTDAITFTTPQRRQTKQSDVRFHTAVLDPDEVVYLDGFPVTTVARTVLDLTRAGHEPGHLSDMITDALVGGLVAKGELAAALGEVAETLGAAGNTTVAMGERLDELVPETETGEDRITRAVREAMAPIQQQLQELFSLISPQVQLPEGFVREYTANLPTIDIDSVASSGLQEILNKDAAGRAKMISDISKSAFDAAAFTVPRDDVQRHREENAGQEKPDVEDTKDDNA